MPTTDDRFEGEHRQLHEPGGMVTCPLDSATATLRIPNDMSITGVTASTPRLIEPAEQPPGEICRYGVAFPFQVAPKLAAVLCCLRNEGYPAGDFENGSDVFLFDRLDGIDPAGAVPIVRNDKYVDAKGQRRIVIHYPIVGGFVPLGARRDDGAPHPHAGTGFGVSESWDFPLLGKGHYTKSHKKTKMIRRTSVYQFSYDTRFFLIDDTDVYDGDAPLRATGPGSEWALTWQGLKQAVPDGDDLLNPIYTTGGDDPHTWLSDPMSSGVARWRRADGAWRPVSYVPVVLGAPASGNESWMEPSMVRDLDGSLLFTCRGVYSASADHMVRIWRSTDNGESWQVIIEKPDARGQAPVTINQAADGTPYIVCNRLGHERDWLVIHPLNDERTDLLPAVDVRNAIEQFGPPPKGPVWFMDHPNGETLRLGDGRWHHVLSYRNMDRGEHSGSTPTPHTGQYLEEVLSDGPPRPAWRFE